MFHFALTEAEQELVKTWTAMTCHVHVQQRSKTWRSKSAIVQSSIFQNKLQRHFPLLHVVCFRNNKNSVLQCRRCWQQCSNLVIFRCVLDRLELGSWPNINFPVAGHRRPQLGRLGVVDRKSEDLSGCYDDLHGDWVRLSTGFFDKHALLLKAVQKGGNFRATGIVDHGTAFSKRSC